MKQNEVNMKNFFLFFVLLLALPIGMLAQGSSWQTATLIYSGSSGSCTLNDNTTEVYYKINVPEEGKVVITETVSDDLSLYSVVLCWVDDAGNIHDRNTLGYYIGSGKTLEVTDVGKGTYYIRAQHSGGKGTATITYQFTASPYANDAEPNDQEGTGAVLKSGETVQGRLGYLDAKDYRDNDDWYKIVLTQDGRIDMTFDAEKVYGLELYSISIYRFNESDGSYPHRQTKGYYLNNGTLTVTDAGAGSYYIKLQRSGGHGGYTLKYNFTPCGHDNDGEPNDEIGQGSEIAIGQTIQGHLGYLDDNDYCDSYDCYKIVVPKDGRIDLTVDCDQTYELSLYSMSIFRFNESDGSYPHRQTKGYYLNNGTLTVTDAGAGSYYIKLQRSGGHGGYTLKYDFTPCGHGNDSEPNGEAGQGEEIAVGQTVQGHLGYLDANDFRDNDDWYKIVVPQDGRVQMAFNCDQTYELELYSVSIHRFNDSDGTYAHRSTSGYYFSNDTLTVNDAGAGTYYIHMQRSGGHGGYKLKYIFTPNRYQNDTESNEELEDAQQTITTNSTLTGHLGYLDDNDKRDNFDWFRLDTEKSSMLTVTVEPDPSSTLEIYSASIVGVKDDKKTTLITKGYYLHEPMTLSIDNVEDRVSYYLCLQRSSGHGGYTILYGASERFEGSEIRIAYIGHNTTRLGIPSPYEVKVENIGSGNTGSFFIAIPATPDIEFLWAEIPTESGIMKVEREDFAIYDSEEGDCAVFMMPNLPPFESYTFTVYMQGRVENASRSNLPIYAVPLNKKEQSLLGALKSSTKKVKDNFEWTAVGEDGITVATVDAFIDAFIFDEKDRQQLGQAIGEVEHGYRSSYREPVAHPIIHYTQKVVQQVNPVLAIPNALVASGKIANSLVTALRRKIWLWIYKDLGYVQDEPQVMDGRLGVDGVVRSWDPNEMCGPLGYGEKHYIAKTTTIDYRILFENKAEATDNAYRIIIDDELDENVFDVSTARFGTTSHEGTEYNWKMSRDGNKLKWEIEGIELPPNVNAPEGEGYVTFSVDLKPGLKNGTQIKNKAAIKFDYNEVIETNEYVNTLDLAVPTTQMKNISKQDDGKFLVTCEGSDSESGISHYMFYASTDGSEYKYLGQNNEPYFSFAAQGNANYSIVALAVDNVGNSQNTTPEAIVFNPTGIRTINVVPDDSWIITHLNGTTVATGHGVPSLTLPAGVYIIRHGSTARKVILK